VERKERENASRAINTIYELARSNHFDWFITLTFDKAKVNRYDYDCCADAIKHFTDILRKRGNQWLLVPEQHKDGAYHFHGLVSGNLPLSPAIHEETGELLRDNHGRQIYNLDIYHYGFTTATKITDAARSATYLTKYLSKDISVPKGRKRYWASRSLNKPMVELLQMTAEEFGEIFNSSRYQKFIPSIWGDTLLCET